MGCFEAKEGFCWDNGAKIMWMLGQVPGFLVPSFYLGPTREFSKKQHPKKLKGVVCAYKVNFLIHLLNSYLRINAN